MCRPVVASTFVLKCLRCTVGHRLLEPYSDCARCACSAVLFSCQAPPTCAPHGGVGERTCRSVGCTLCTPVLNYVRLSSQHITSLCLRCVCVCKIHLYAVECTSLLRVTRHVCLCVCHAPRVCHGYVTHISAAVCLCVCHTPAH